MDPVMGDNGKFYVPEASAPAFRSLLPHADLVLPNQFELEALTGHPVQSLKDVLAAIGLLHSQHQVEHVLITSTSPTLAEQEIASGRITRPADGEHMLLIGSSATSTHLARPFALLIPCFPVSFTGTGDMFAALITAHFRATAQEAGILSVHGMTSADDIKPSNLPLAKAAERTVEGMQTVLTKTYNNYKLQKSKLDSDTKMGDVERHKRQMRALELRVIGNMHEVMNLTGGSIKARDLQS
jgi:pyridoxine kinase